MKKNRKEIILLILILFFAVGTFYFYKGSKNIVTMDEIKYEEKGNVNYKVYLTDKQYYNRDYLDEGMQYISSIIDYVEVTFNYNANYDKKDTYNIAKKISADVKIVDRDNNDKVIYSKNEVLKQENTKSDKIELTDTLKVDYKKYNTLTNEFKSSYGISANCDLVVSYNIQYSDSSNEISQNKVMTVSIPLSQQMINISKSESIYKNDSYVGTTTEATINKAMLILSMVFLIVTLTGIIVLIKLIADKKKKESKYENFIKKTLREYDSYITTAKFEGNDSDKTVIKVESFKELLDVRNSVEKAIVYVKVDENTSKFMLIDNEIYEYTVTRSELDK